MRAVSLLAVPAACAVVVVAYSWGGGAVAGLAHGASALIVLGGTGAATLVSYSLADIARAVRAVLRAFRRDDTPMGALAAQLVEWAMRAHRSGVLALDADLEGVKDPYLQHALSLAVDGVDVAVLRDVLTAEGRAREAEEDLHVRVLETAAGYAPTFGMLGAVLGLMQVMAAIDQPGRLGSGIATAFVATVYGLALANMLLLPLAGRLRERLLAGVGRRALILEVVVGLRQRTHPRLIAATIRGIAPAAYMRLEASEPRAPEGSRAVRPS